MVGDFANFQRKESLTFLEFFLPIQSMISLEKFTDKCGRKGILSFLTGFLEIFALKLLKCNFINDCEPWFPKYLIYIFNNFYCNLVHIFHHFWHSSHMLNISVQPFMVFGVQAKKTYGSRSVS